MIRRTKLKKCIQRKQGLVSVGAIDTESYPSNANEAMMRLKNGNQRFMDDIPRHNHEQASLRSLLVETQKPFATIVGCSDSRVPPELIFDEGFGELFTIRLAGNIIAEDVVGSLQYAVAHLHTRLIAGAVYELNTGRVRFLD